LENLKNGWFSSKLEPELAKTLTSYERIAQVRTDGLRVKRHTSWNGSFRHAVLFGRLPIPA
jgi:hypothetical protein